MKKKFSSLILIVIGIFIIFWGISGGIIGNFLMPIVGIFLILIGISLFVKMKRWYWIAIILFIILIAYFILLLFIPPAPPLMNPQEALTKACMMLIKGDCDVSTDSISVGDFDADKNGIENDSGDTLFALCKNYYDLKTDSECKKMCGCSLCSQNNSLLCDRSCNSDDDCELSCGCGCISKSEECRYAGIVCEAPGPYEECKCVNNECKYFNPPP